MSDLWQDDPLLESYDDFGFNGYYKDTPMFLETYLEIKGLQTRLKEAEEIIRCYGVNYDYYRDELAGSWKEINDKASTYLNKYKKETK